MPREESNVDTNVTVYFRNSRRRDGPLAPGSGLADARRHRARASVLLRPGDTDDVGTEQKMRFDGVQGWRHPSRVSTPPPRTAPSANCPRRRRRRISRTPPRRTPPRGCVPPGRASVGTPRTPRGSADRTPSATRVAAIRPGRRRGRGRDRSRPVEARDAPPGPPRRRRRRCSSRGWPPPCPRRRPARGDARRSPPRHRNSSRLYFFALAAAGGSSGRWAPRRRRGGPRSIACSGRLPMPISRISSPTSWRRVRPSPRASWSRSPPCRLPWCARNWHRTPRALWTRGLRVGAALARRRAGEHAGEELATRARATRGDAERGARGRATGGARDADASARTHLRGTRRKWRRRSTCRAVRGDDAARSSTRRVRAMEPEMEATGETVRSRASTRRTPGVLRRGQTVSGDEETLARGSTTTRAYSQWRGPRGAPRPRRFPVGKTPVGFRTNQNAGKRPNTAAQNLARSSGSRGAPRAIFSFSRRGVSLGWRSRSRRSALPSARRSGRRISRDANHGCHGTSHDRAIDRRGSLRVPTPADEPPVRREKRARRPASRYVRGCRRDRARRPPR